MGKIYKLEQTIIFVMNKEIHNKYNFNSRELRKLEEMDDLFNSDIKSRADNVWKKDPWEWLRKVKILKEKKY